MASLTGVWFRSQCPALSGSTKGVVSLGSHALAGFSTESRPSSETGRRPTMARASGDTSSRVPNLTAMRRGQGFRSSFSGRVATVFGCSGVLGRVVCSRLGKSGTQMILPYRCDHYEVLRLRVMGDLGQVLFHEFGLRDEESVRTAMKYSDVVINLIGREYETRNFTFDDVHNKGARLLARCAREAGVKNFIHISHINAAENPKTVWSNRGSDFLRSKWAGEVAVMEEFPDATIFRPVQLVGLDDWFTRYYDCWWRTGLDSHTVPLWKKGEYTVKQPLTLKNMGDAIMAALDDPAAKGQIYEAMGGERFLLSEFLDWIHELMNKRESGYCRTDIRIDFAPVLKAIFLQKFMLGQKYWRGHTLERLERTQLSEESQGLPNITELGVKLERMEDVLEWILYPLKDYKTFYHPPVAPAVPLTGMREAEALSKLEQRSSIKGLLGF